MLFDALVREFVGALVELAKNMAYVRVLERAKEHHRLLVEGLKIGGLDLVYARKLPGEEFAVCPDLDRCGIKLDGLAKRPDKRGILGHVISGFPYILTDLAQNGSIFRGE